MSSLPPRQPSADPHTLSHAENIQQATAKVNRFAKRDPALYPLAFILTAGLLGAGYFLMSKASEPEPHRALVQNGMVNPWDHKDSHDVHPSSTAMFKYRHKTREGHMEDSLPALNEDVRKLKEGLNPKFKAA